MSGAALHRLPHAEAIALRFERGVVRYRGGDLSRRFVGDAAAEAFEEALDLEIYAEEMVRQGYSRALASNVKRHAREAARLLRRVLVARERGGVMDPDPAIRMAREAK